MLEMQLSIHLMCLQEHVDDARGSVAPVHQQVPTISHARRVVPRGELEMTDVVDAGLDHPANVLLSRNKARLRPGQRR